MKKSTLLIVPILALATICNAEDGTATAAPTPPSSLDFADSIAFPATVVSISATSITFKDGEIDTTLPIGPWTRFLGVKSAAEIRPGSQIGIRLSSDKKTVLVLNANAGG